MKRKSTTILALAWWILDCRAFVSFRIQSLPEARISLSTTLWGSSNVPLGNETSNDNVVHQRTTTTLKKGPRPPSRRVVPHRDRPMKQSEGKIMTILDSFEKAEDIDKWMRDQSIADEASIRDEFRSWKVSRQHSFIRYLEKRRAYEAIDLFMDKFARENVYLFTTALFSVASSPDPHPRALKLLHRMDQRRIKPTTLTFTALLGSAAGPKQTSEMIKIIDGYKDIQLDSEVYNSAIYGCQRKSRHRISSEQSSSSEEQWKTALNLFQRMRRNRVPPTSKTYLALLQVVGKTEKIKIALSLFREAQSAPDVVIDDRLWGAILNVCAASAQYATAITLFNEMTASGHRPNLRHCSSLLRALAKAGKGGMAYEALDMMLGRYDLVLDGELASAFPNFTIHPTPPDLIAVNTVLSACSKSKQVDATECLFARLKDGMIKDSEGKELQPDHISYHCVLASCRRPEIATGLIREMRLTRRNRFGAVPPNSVSYAHAIHACQNAEYPDLEAAKMFLSWARDDGVQATVFMYSSAIYTAVRSERFAEAVELFEEMKEVGCRPNSISYDGVLAAIKSPEEALDLFKEMLAGGVAPTRTTYRRLADIFKLLHPKEKQMGFFLAIFETMGTRDLSTDVGGPIIAPLITLLGEADRYDEAKKLFDGAFGSIDGPSLRAILLAASRASPPRWEDALEILHTSDIFSETSGPGKVDQVALGYAIIACSKADEFYEALTVLQLYATPSKSSECLSVAAVNALISSCGRGGRADLSLALINEMESKFGAKPDHRSYRSAMIACNQAQHEQVLYRAGGLVNEELGHISWWECALSLWRRMKEDNLAPDVQTISSVISACESAGQWQRALGILQTVMDGNSNNKGLNLYCFNAAISACEKGGAWIEALDLYERMMDQGGKISPNFVTLNSLIVALDKAGQEELAQSKYEEARRMKIVNPWRKTLDERKEEILAIDLHRYSAPLAKAALRDVLDKLATRPPETITDDLVIITGKGITRAKSPILGKTVSKLLLDRYRLDVEADASNRGRITLNRALQRSISLRSSGWNE